MIEIYKFRDADQILKPRRVRRFVLICCVKGRAEAIVDASRFELSPNTVITITSGQVHSLIPMAGSDGFVLEFTYDFFCLTDSDIELVFRNSLFCHFAMNEVIPLGKTSLVRKELESISEELEHEPFQFLASIHSRLKLILIDINRSKLEQGGEVYMPDALFLKFLEALRENYDKKPTTADLARIVGTTSAKLNELSKFHTGRTAQMVIHGQTALEAKRLLAFEKLSVKETAYRLGFEDPFYFSNFFKKHIGVSPKTFQETS